MNIHIRNLNTFTNQHQKRKWLYESLLRKSESSRPLALTRTTSSVPCGIFLLLLLLLLCSFFSSYKRISEKVKIQIPIERCEAFVWLVGFLINLSFSILEIVFSARQMEIYILGLEDWSKPIKMFNVGPVCTSYARITYQLNRWSPLDQVLIQRKRDHDRDLQTQAEPLGGGSFHGVSWWDRVSWWYICNPRLSS